MPFIAFMILPRQVVPQDAGGAAHQIWHLIDVPLVVCAGGDGFVKVHVDVHDVPIMDWHSLHVLTFHRTFAGPVALKYKVVDSLNKTIINTNEVSLEDMHSFRKRRLQAMRPKAGLLTWRSRPRTTSRTHILASLGRRQPAIDGLALGAAAAVFIPQGYRQTGYGYSGTPASTGSVYMVGNDQPSSHVALSRFGEVASKECTFGSWRGSCADCYSQYSPLSCKNLFDPVDVVARDEMLGEAFLPQSFQSPFEIQITSLAGQDVAASRICPPWNATLAANQVRWSPPEKQDMYVSLTKVVSMDPDFEEFASDGLALWVFGTLGVCCCCSAIIFFSLLARAHKHYFVRVDVEE